MRKRQMFVLELSLHRGVRQKSRLEFLAERPRTPLKGHELIRGWRDVWYRQVKEHAGK